MRAYPKLKQAANPTIDRIIVLLNAGKLRKAKKNCVTISKAERRPYYVMDMHGMYLLLNSSEKSDMNSKVAKGAEMNIADFYKFVIFQTNQQGKPTS